MLCFGVFFSDKQTKPFKQLKQREFLLAHYNLFATPSSSFKKILDVLAQVVLTVLKFAHHHRLKSNMDLTEDPLQPVPWTKMAELSNKLLSDVPYSLSVYGAVQQALRWKETDNAQRMMIYSTDNNCYDVGGIVAVCKQSDSIDQCHRIYLHCFNEDMQNLKNALLTTKRFRWITSETIILFAAVAQKLMPLVENFVSQYEFEVRGNDTMIYKWRMPEQLGFGDIRCPPEVRLAPLGLESLEQIRSNWFYEGGATEYLATLIKHNPTMGVYSRSSGELCAWVLFNEFCTLTALYTMEQHRRKGYAQLVIKAISERLLSEGLMVGAIIYEVNEASLKLFDSLQFKSSRDIFHYVEALPSTQDPYV